MGLARAVGWWRVACGALDRGRQGRAAVVQQSVSCNIIRTLGGPIVRAEAKPVFSHWNLSQERREGMHATGTQCRGLARSARSRARWPPRGCVSCFAASRRAGRHHEHGRCPGRSLTTRLTSSRWCDIHSRGAVGQQRGRAGTGRAGYRTPD